MHIKSLSKHKVIAKRPFGKLQMSVANNGVLTIDIGNSNTVLGHFERAELKHMWRVPSEARAVSSWFVKHRPLSKRLDRIVVSSVVPALTAVTRSASQKWFRQEALVITARQCPLKTKVQKPSQVGVDRLIDAVAAHRLWKRNTLVIDIGTATTLDVVTSQGEFLGGLIVPGPQTINRALHRDCAQLPLLPLRKTKSVLGRSTNEAIQAGVYWGYVSLLEGLIERMQKRFRSSLFIVATGGLAPLFAPSLPIIDRVHPTLTLEGLMFLASSSDFMTR